MPLRAAKEKLPPGWKSGRDPDMRRTYYIHPLTKHKTWKRPQWPEATQPPATTNRDHKQAPARNKAWKHEQYMEPPKRPQRTNASQPRTAAYPDSQYTKPRIKVAKQEKDVSAPELPPRTHRPQPRTAAYPDDQHSKPRRKATSQERDIEAPERPRRMYGSPPGTTVYSDHQHVKTITKPIKQEREVGAPEVRRPQQTDRSQPPITAYPAANESLSMTEKARQRERDEEIAYLEAQLAAEPPSCCRHWFFWIFSFFGWVIWSLTIAAIKGEDWIRQTADSIEEFRVEDDGADDGLHASCEEDLPSSQWCSAFNAFTITQTVAIVVISFAMLLLLAALCRPNARGVGWAGGSVFFLYAALQATVIALVAGLRSSLESSTDTAFLIFSSGRDINFGNTYAIACLAAFLGAVEGITLLALASKAGPGLVYNCVFNKDSGGDKCCWGSDAIDGDIPVVESSVPSRRHRPSDAIDRDVHVGESSQSSRRRPSSDAIDRGARVRESSQPSRRRPSSDAVDRDARVGESPQSPRRTSAPSYGRSNNYSRR